MIKEEEGMDTSLPLSDLATQGNIVQQQYINRNRNQRKRVRAVKRL